MTTLGMSLAETPGRGEDGGELYGMSLRAIPGGGVASPQREPTALAADIEAGLLYESK